MLVVGIALRCTAKCKYTLHQCLLIGQFYLFIFKIFHTFIIKLLTPKTDRLYINYLHFVVNGLVLTK